MNILIVTLAYDPAVAFGGPVKIVQNNARELVRRGHRVTVYCTNRLDATRKLASRTIEQEDQGVRVVYHNIWFMPQWRGNFGPFFCPGMIAYFLREGRQYDIIHINEARAFTTLAAALYARFAHIPYIIQAHGSFAYGLRHQRLKRIYDSLVGRAIYRRASRAIASSPEEVRECEAVGVERDKFVVIGNGIDFATWHFSEEEGLKFRARFGIARHAKVILFLSRIDKKKGPDILTEAFAQIQIPDAYCIIAGPDNGYEEYVRQLVKSYNLTGKVIFTGLLRGSDIRAAYAAADVFVLPSRFDTFPMALVEAMASGVPVITTETCQIAQMVRDRAGLVTPVEVRAIADALQTLLADEDLRRRFAEGARLLAEEEFSVAKVVDRLEEIYVEVLREHKYG